MTSKHYGWHKRWTLAPDRLSAEHATGLRVRYVAGQAHAENMAITQLVLIEQHGGHNAPAMAGRLMREAQMLLDFALTRDARRAEFEAETARLLAGKNGAKLKASIESLDPPVGQSARSPRVAQSVK